MLFTTLKLQSFPSFIVTIITITITITITSCSCCCCCLTYLFHTPCARTAKEKKKRSGLLTQAISRSILERVQHFSSLFSLPRLQPHAPKLVHRSSSSSL